jgi:hypothetical protein
VQQRCVHRAYSRARRRNVPCHPVADCRRRTAHCSAAELHRSAVSRTGGDRGGAAAGARITQRYALIVRAS